MKEKVLSLAKGNFIYEAPALVLKPEELKISLAAGETRTEKIEITNKKGTKVKGFGSVEEQGIEFLPVFNAEKNELELVVDSSRWAAGSTVRGNITFVTDCGEAALPYEITVRAPQLSDEKGVVPDYLTLRTRMRDNPEEGAKLFHSPEFRELFLRRDNAGKILYDHLVKNNTRLQSMEEFLVAVGKKQRFRFEVKHAGSGSPPREIEYELMGADIQDSVKIQINTWGSTGIKIHATADFIRPEASVVRADEFERDTNILEYTILADKVNPGIRYGSLVLESPYERKEILIQAHNIDGAKKRKVERAKKAVFTTLFRMYLAYNEDRVSGGDLQALIRDNRHIITKIQTSYQYALKGMIAAFLDDETGMLVFYRDVERIPMPEDGSPLAEVENYILIEYAKYMYSQREEDRERVQKLIEAYRDRGYGSLALFFLQMKVDSSYESVHWKMEEIRRWLGEGANSPLLYSELMMMYRGDPAMIREMDPITVAALDYGAREDLITEDMAVVISFLAERSARWQPVAFRLMARIYEKFQSADMLRAICTLLIRNEERSRKYFYFFEEGVKKQLHITELYEYYFYSMNRAKTLRLPESALTYFRYENHLDTASKAFLYAYIIRKKDEMPEFFEAYRESIFDFSLKQLGSRRISEDLSVLYEAAFGGGGWQDEKIAKALPGVMYVNLLTCSHPGIEEVLVVHAEVEKEEYYPIVAGSAKIQLYTPNYQLFFIDGDRRFYSGTVEYRIQKLLDMDGAAQACYESGARTPELVVSLASAAERGIKMTREKAMVISEVLQMDVLRDYTRGRYLLCLYDFYKRENDEDGLLGVLDAWEPAQIKKERSGEVAADCIYHGMYDKAEELLTKNGISGCDNKALSMLLLDRIHANGDCFSPLLEKWALHLFREKYFEWGTLNYLLKYYMGATKTLTAIYRKCRELSPRGIEDGSKERLLGQVLFTGTNPSGYGELFEEYYTDGSNRVLVKAFLAVIAYEYIVGRVKLPESIFKKIEKEAFYAKEPVMVLAALKYYSAMREYDLNQKNFIERQLDLFAGSGKIFSFMKDFSGKVAVPCEIENPVLIEHYSGTDGGVFLFLRDKAGGKYEGQPMVKVFQGIFTREILLFDDEEKSGYIYEEETDKKTGEFVLRRDGEQAGGNGFYRIVNQMIDAKKHADDEHYRELREDCMEKYQMAGKLFQIL